jgi:hypothetical protein
LKCPSLTRVSICSRLAIPQIFHGDQLLDSALRPTKKLALPNVGSTLSISSSVPRAASTLRASLNGVSIDVSLNDIQVREVQHL